MRGDDDDIHATIEPSSLFAGIVGNRVILGITGGGETLRTDTLAREQDSYDLGGPRGGEFPIGLE
jgi:hypothetical protein